MSPSLHRPPGAPDDVPPDDPPLPGDPSPEDPRPDPNHAPDDPGAPGTIDLA